VGGGRPFLRGGLNKRLYLKALFDVEIRRSLTVLVVVVSFSLGMLSATATQAQNWPERTVKVIVPSAAGGTGDILTRLIVDRLGTSIGQTIVVENRPGGGGNIASAAAARSLPDGYTLFACGSPTHSFGKLLYKNLSYDPMIDLPPFAMTAISPNVLVVRPSLLVNSLEQLIARAKSQSGQLTYSSSGVGTSGYIAGELMKKMTGIEAQHVPYKSGPDSVTAVLAGHVDFTFFTVPGLMPYVQEGKLRALAITSAARSALMTSVPTVAELGYPGFEVVAWYGLCVPVNTPEPIISRLVAETRRIVAAPELKERLATLGSEPYFLNAQGVADFVAKDAQRWSKILATVAPQ